MSFYQNLLTYKLMNEKSKIKSKNKAKIYIADFYKNGLAIKIDNDSEANIINKLDALLEKNEYNVDLINTKKYLEKTANTKGFNPYELMEKLIEDKVYFSFSNKLEAFDKYNFEEIFTNYCLEKYESPQVRKHFKLIADKKADNKEVAKLFFDKVTNEADTYTILCCNNYLKFACFTYKNYTKIYNNMPVGVAEKIINFSKNETNTAKYYRNTYKEVKNTVDAKTNNARNLSVAEGK